MHFVGHILKLHDVKVARNVFIAQFSDNNTSSVNAISSDRLMIQNDGRRKKISSNQPSLAAGDCVKWPRSLTHNAKISANVESTMSALQVACDASVRRSAARANPTATERRRLCANAAAIGARARCIRFFSLTMESLEIVDFKSFKRTHTIKQLPQFVAIVGANGSGK